MKYLTAILFVFLLSYTFIPTSVLATPTRTPVPEDIWITNRDSEESGDTFLLHVGRRSQRCIPETPWSTEPNICPPLEAASVFKFPKDFNLNTNRNSNLNTNLIHNPISNLNAGLNPNLPTNLNSYLNTYVNTHQTSNLNADLIANIKTDLSSNQITTFNANLDTDLHITSLYLYLQESVDTETHEIKLCGIDADRAEDITWITLGSSEQCFTLSIDSDSGWHQIHIPSWIAEKSNFLALIPGGQNSFWLSLYSADHPSLFPYFETITQEEINSDIDPEESNPDPDITDTTPEVLGDSISPFLDERQDHTIPYAKPEIPSSSQAQNQPSQTSALRFLPTCTINFHMWDNTFRIVSCSIPSPLISSITAKDSKNSAIIHVTGQYPDFAYITVNHIPYAERSLFKPETWLKSSNTPIKITHHRIDISARILYEIPSSKSEGRSTITTAALSHQFMIPRYDSLPLIHISGQYFGHLRIDSTWINIDHTTPVNKYHLPLLTTPMPSHKPFYFPLAVPAGVTQWHGYTAFQSPHTGIDFAVTEQKIFAPADGTVVYSGWDSTYGKCLSGGNILIIRHDEKISTQNRHTAYFHLKNFKGSNGADLTIGNIVKKGDLIGITGNTGSWNCQPLGHHLHFETRTARSQSTHVDPVPLVNVDWNTIHTVDWNIYPGRLTGDNPHPGY